MSFFSSRKKPDPEKLRLKLARPGLSPDFQNRLAEFILKTPEAELSRLNPKALSLYFGLAEVEMLNLFAVGFREGIFRLSWEVECPVCNTTACYFKGPRDSYHQIKCVGCGRDYEAHFDQQVHITFSLHPDVLGQASSQTEPKLKLALPKLPVSPVAPLTAHELLTVQGFRDFFKNETLPPGESFEVQRCVILFTDLTGSTAMYVRKGDPHAYTLVREHFEVLKSAVNQAGGAIVKTIGDAVMAVFVSEVAALSAALSARQEMLTFNRNYNLPVADHLLIKIGLHTGPSIYVTLDDRLDYFGTTVNTAARVEGQAGSNEIVFTEAVLQAPGVREFLHDYELQDTTTMLKGLEGSLRLWKLAAPQ